MSRLPFDVPESNDERAPIDASGPAASWDPPAWDPAPDADLHSVGKENFDWVVNAVADLAVKKATEPVQPATYRWDALLRS